MINSCSKFLQSQLSKGGKEQYVALLILAALEKNRKDLLKKADYAFIQSNLRERNNENQAS